MTTLGWCVLIATWLTVAFAALCIWVQCREIDHLHATLRALSPRDLEPWS